MKVLVYSMAGHGFQEACQYEAALEQSAKGNEVLFAYCDGLVGLCGENRRCDKSKCKICAQRFKRRIKHYLNPKIRLVPISAYLTESIVDEAKDVHFDYNSNDDLKALNYHGVDIGYGAMSSYITWTRNLNPNYIGKVREYFDLLLSIEVKLTLIIENLLNDYKPDLVIFHNGRYIFYKPVYRLAQKNKIPFVCSETAFDLDQNVYREFIDNDVPHSVDFWTKKMNMYWGKDTDHERRDRIGRLFYENRKNAKFSGDKIYIKDQVQGKLPVDFDSTKENIAIFNSSEDELGAIGQEVEKYALFKSQYDAIIAIAERYKNDESKHFYLRVHPNLNGLPFDYHINLYKLQYPNLTVIPGNSDISSYSLMDAANKVIVFGSTMGAESAYWKKPVICMSFAFYHDLGCVYTPNTIEEAWRLIETRNLPILDSDASLKFGYAILTPIKEHFHFVHIEDSVFVFRGRKRIHPSTDKLLGSVKLAYLRYTFLTELYKKLTFLGRFSCVPV